MATTSLPGAFVVEPPMPETKDFIYATEYSFLPLGVRKVKQSFSKKLAKENLVSRPECLLWTGITCKILVELDYAAPLFQASDLYIFNNIHTLNG
jgi:hypothetical protein